MKEFSCDDETYNRSCVVFHREMQGRFVEQKQEAKKNSNLVTSWRGAAQRFHGRKGAHQGCLPSRPA